MVERKRIPRQTVSNLIPPFADYVYFEDPHRFPFRPLAAEFDPVNAGWLMDASMLVYGEEGWIRERVSRFAEAVRGVRVRLFNGTSTQGLVLQLPEVVIVAFRGTRIDRILDGIDLLPRPAGAPAEERRRAGVLWAVNWRDFLSDAKFALGSDGIHLGFRQALDQPGVWTEIVAYLATLGERPVWFTGHSLGAALATIAAARYAAMRPVQGLYTFGSPRVGNRQFVQSVPANAMRIVNNADLVAGLPPPIAGYKHAGQFKFLCAQGTIGDDHRNRDPWQVRLQKTLTALQQLVPEGVKRGLSNPREFLQRLQELDIELPQSRWSDHAPVNYACKIWNAVTEPDGKPVG
ncbi:MAG: hypothetical protein JSS02_18445 [Planctomycetes bacterium]|nr:hypothetical protein [Planctomycetota bacterium]